MAAIDPVLDPDRDMDERVQLRPIQQHLQQNHHLSSSAPRYPSPQRPQSQPFLPRPSAAAPDYPAHGNPLSQQTDGPNGFPPLPPSAYRPLIPHPNPGPVASGGSKKETKKRTKTGCLTCRKRRIKCDEGHPTCGNCRKSKRECRGYEAIYKSPRVSTVVGYPPLESRLPYMQPQSSSTPQHHHLQHHQIYPASAGGHHPMQYAARVSSPTARATASQSSPTQHDTPLESSLHSTLAASIDSSSSGSGQQSPSLPFVFLPRRTWKPLSVDQLFLGDGVSSNAIADHESSAPLPASDEAAGVYLSWRVEYATMLNTFFETSWYTLRGEPWLQASPRLMAFFALCNKRLKNRHQDISPEEAAVTSSMEATLIWRLAGLARTAWKTNQMADRSLADLLHRLDVTEHLLTGTVMPIALIPPIPDPSEVAPGPQPSGQEYLRHQFWCHLGVFCSTDDTSPDTKASADANAHIETAMGEMRCVLSAMEHRDVLYSIAIVRHLGGRLDGLDVNSLLTSPPSDPERPAGQLGIALKFLSEEEHASTNMTIRTMATVGKRALFRARAAGQP